MQVSLDEWHNPVTQAPFMPNLTHKVEMAPQIQLCVPSAPNKSYKNVQTVYWSQKIHRDTNLSDTWLWGGADTKQVV